MGKKDFSRRGASALFGKTRQALLCLFFLHPERSFYAYELITLAKAGHGSVQRELKRLSGAGIIRGWRRGRLVFYQADPGCPIFPELKNLAVKSSGIPETIAEFLDSAKRKIQLAFLYGSYVKGDFRADSDVDLFVVADPDAVELHRAVRRAEEKIARTINYTLMSKGEFRRKRKDPAGFVAQVLQGPRIDIITGGNEI
jgi:predicted nucleotidyltransferase